MDLNPCYHCKWQSNEPRPNGLNQNMAQPNQGGWITRREPENQWLFNCMTMCLKCGQCSWDTIKLSTTKMIREVTRWLEKWSDLYANKTTICSGIGGITGIKRTVKEQERGITDQRTNKRRDNWLGSCITFLVSDLLEWLKLIKAPTDHILVHFVQDAPIAVGDDGHWHNKLNDIGIINNWPFSFLVFSHFLTWNNITPVP